MTQWLAVGIGGFLGAIARYGLWSFTQRRFDGGFPSGTLAVNVLGCFLIGAMWAAVEQRELFGPNARLLLGVGFLGSLTTFSTFGYESIELMRIGEMRLVFLSVAANVALGFGAVALGRALVRLLG